MTCREIQRLFRIRKRTGTCWTGRATEFPVRPAMRCGATPPWLRSKKINKVGVGTFVPKKTQWSCCCALNPVTFCRSCSTSSCVMLFVEICSILRETERERDSFVYQYLLTASVLLSSQTKTPYFTGIYMDL